MNTSFEKRYASSPEAVGSFNTAQLRHEFLIEKLMGPDEIHWVYTHYDRYMVGSAIPATSDIELATLDLLKSSYFLERRELGIINVGDPGNVEVDGKDYLLGYKDALYVGKGTQKVIFKASSDGQTPKFYLNSAPAHARFPTALVSKDQAKKLELGSVASANKRIVYQMIVSEIVATCQLQMGMTELTEGSVWNTMPAHVHDRRMEVYFYFEVPKEQSVCHFMGEVEETRHIWIQNEQAVISPPWSIHAGSGTSNYTFIWGMAGENLDYTDMDVARIIDLK